MAAPEASTSASEPAAAGPAASVRTPGSADAGAPDAAGRASFFRSRWVRPPDGIEELDPSALAPGFRAAGLACGIKAGGATDLALVSCDAADVSSALLLTRNAAAAAPVRVCRQECDPGAIRAAIVNSGNANAATGEQGYRDALAMRDAAAGALGLTGREVAVAGTGTIGLPLPIEAILGGVDALAERLSADGGEEFSGAIMTTDRWPKRCTVRLGGVTVSAQAKGGGMIEPGFATMLCFAQTDAVLADPEATLRAAVDESFERITVDGQMSTNDTVLLQASGTSGLALPQGLLEPVLGQLALEIVADGEGATRAARVMVSEAATVAEAERVARAIANSPLVKTALHGREANWGRIAQAAGAALAGEELEGLGPGAIDADELATDAEEVEIAVRLGRGGERSHVYFCDLTPEYVSVNSEYTT
jgi:glutamate N-acetyltransferase/amino-acid N-acetyltransferase